MLIEDLKDMGVTDATIKQALSNLAGHTACWVVVSGKMGSGKDTVAPLVPPALGYTDVERVGYSDPMKAEYQTIIDMFGEAPYYIDLEQEVTSPLVTQLGYKPQHAAAAAELVLGVLQSAPGKVGGWDRTNANRLVLQNIGADWRTEDDEAYWSKRVTVTCLEKIADGTSVYLTGGRFEPDVAIPQAMGAKIIRLDVSQEVQLKRLLDRDGVVPTEEELSHPGEVALDEWSHFDVRIDNNGTLEECMKALLAKLEGNKA